MIVDVQPRALEPGAFRRWNVEAARLLLRRPGYWITLILPCAGFVILAWGSRVALIFDSVFFYLLFVSAAYNQDACECGRRTLPPRGLRPIVLIAVYAAMIAAPVGLTSALLGLSNDDPWRFWYDATLAHHLSELPALRAATKLSAGFMVSLVISVAVISSAPGSARFAFHLMAFGACDRSTAVQLSSLAERLDGPRLRGLSLAPLLATMVVFAVSPVFAPLASAFCAALTSMAYRDIFLARPVASNPLVPPDRAMT